VKHQERPSVERRERRHVPVPADKHVGAGPEAKILPRRRNGGVDRRRRSKGTEGVAELGKKL